MPLGKVFWGAYFGMFIDKFGIQVDCQSQIQINKGDNEPSLTLECSNKKELLS
jgi:hypothetical protein